MSPKRKNIMKEIPLHTLKINQNGRIVRYKKELRQKQRFADIGIIPGVEIILQAQAPVGGLIRVKVMNCSIALHTKDAQNIILEVKEVEDEA